MLKINEVYNMDCMEAIKLLDDNSIDLVVMDPPYLLNLNKIKNTSSINNYANELMGLKDGFDLKVLDMLIPKMKKINMYIYCSKRQVKDLIEYFINKDCNYEILTWHKQNPSPLINNNYLPDTEYVIFAREKGVKLYGSYHTKRKYYISGVNQIDKKKYKHPTIKPLPFIENHIINSSKEGELILDCYCGSGTTLVGAIETNRNFIGFEIDKNYYEIAKQRVEEALEQKELNIETKNSE
jgi:DNA modification methylase